MPLTYAKASCTFLGKTHSYNTFSESPQNLFFSINNILQPGSANTFDPRLFQTLAF